MAQPADLHPTPAMGDDPRYGPTASQLKAMRDEINAGLQRVAGTSSLPERRRLMAAHELFLQGVRERMRMLRKELKYLEWMTAGIAPAEFRGPLAQQLLAVVLAESDGRIWLTDLVAATNVFQMNRSTFWAVLRKLERDGTVKVHQSPLSKGQADPVPSWVEMVTMTGGDGVPPGRKQRKPPLDPSRIAIHKRDNHYRKLRGARG
jgi:hypothetical protein